MSLGYSLVGALHLVEDGFHAHGGEGFGKALDFLEVVDDVAQEAGLLVDAHADAEVVLINRGEHFLSHFPDGGGQGIGVGFDASTQIGVTIVTQLVVGCDIFYFFVGDENLELLVFCLQGFVESLEGVVDQLVFVRLGCEEGGTCGHKLEVGSVFEVSQVDFSN